MDGGHSESNRGSFFQRARSWLKCRGSFFQRARSWLKCRGSFFQRACSCWRYRGSFFQRVCSCWRYRGSFFQRAPPRGGGESRKIRELTNATLYNKGVERKLSSLFFVFVRLILFLLVFLDHHCDHAPYEPDDYADDQNDDAISNGRTHSLSLFYCCDVCVSLYCVHIGGFQLPLLLWRLFGIRCGSGLIILFRGKLFFLHRWPGARWTGGCGCLLLTTLGRLDWGGRRAARR